MYFAHNGIGHGNEIEATTHSIPMLLGLTFTVVVALAFAYWLLNYKSKSETKDEKEK